QLRQLLVPLGNDRFRVSEAFRRFATWDRFHVLVSQMRPIVSEYTSLTYENVLIYEFFMPPLTNEEHLRASLDALFYKDTTLHRLRTVAPASLKQHFPEKPGEAFAIYLDRTTDGRSTMLGGTRSATSAAGSRRRDSRPSLKPQRSRLVVPGT